MDATGKQCRWWLVIVVATILGGRTEAGAQSVPSIPVLDTVASAELEAALSAPTFSLASLTAEDDPTASSVANRLLTGGWLPVLNAAEADVFWTQARQKLHSEARLVVEDDFVGASLEALSDLVGPVRLGIGVAIATVTGEEPDADPMAPADEAADEQAKSVTRLLNEGGTLHATAQWPLFNSMSRDKKAARTIMLGFKVAADAPAEGETLDDPALAGILSASGFYQRDGLKGLLGVHLSILYNRFFYNESYRTKIDVEQGGEVVAIDAGLTLARKTRVSVVWRLYRSEVFEENSSVVISVRQVG